MRVGIVTVSDRSSQGLREDTSGKLLNDLIKTIPADVVGYRTIPDEKNQIQATLISFVDDLRCDVVLTTGGTGMGPRDVTPEATSEVIEKEIPGISESLRREGFKQTPLAILSRGMAGVRKGCLIVNLPGSPQAVKEAFEILKPILTHTVELIQGRVTDCQKVRE
ncbi:MAG: molybdopterin adenylyltransferase [Candidatus Omnitrophica bacterium]|nr:molybdopterin adenylyltransferase [Candidatus Omnitrophota bacterium]